MIISFIKKILGKKIKRSVKEQLGVPSLHGSLQMLKSRGFLPTFAIDGGAYEGEWTLGLLEVFPEARVLMIEAQAAKGGLLQTVADQYPNVILYQAVLSAQDGKRVMFVENETASHVASETFDNKQGISTETLDTIILRGGYPFPDFIKLDVQGYELEVLKGATQCLAFAEFCLLEVSLLEIGNEPLISEVIPFMDDRGFQEYDICQFMRRPYDQALYQIDLLFINKTSSLISEKRWT